MSPGVMRIGRAYSFRMGEEEAAFCSVSVDVQHPETGIIQDLVLRLRGVWVDAVFGDARADKFKVRLLVCQDAAEATARMLSDIGRGLRAAVVRGCRQLQRSASDADELERAFDPHNPKIVVDVLRCAASKTRRRSAFSMETGTGEDLPMDSLFVPFRPFECDVLLHVPNVLVCPSTSKMVLAIQEAVVLRHDCAPPPPPPSVQESLLRPGKKWYNNDAVASM